MNRLNFLSSSLIATPILLALALAPTPAQASKPAPGLFRAQSCSNVRSRLIDLLTDQALRRNPYRYKHRRHWGRRGRMDDRISTRPRPTAKRSADAPRAAAEAAPSRSALAGKAKSGGGSAGPSHFTGTNNQVDGVDEADRVKTDGRHIYTLFGREVLVLKSWPVSSTTVLGRFQVKGGFTPKSLFLKGKQLMVLSQGSHRRVTRRGRPAWWSKTYTRTTRITLLDISNKRRPKRMAAVELEGNMLQARLIGSEAFMVSNDPLNLPSDFWQRVWSAQPNKQSPNFRPWGAAPSQQNWSMRERVKRALTGISVKELLPSISFYDGSGSRIKDRPLHRCDELYIPRTAARLGLLSLTKLGLYGGRVQSAGVMAGGQRVYASMSNLYVSTTAHRWHWNRSKRWGYNGTQIHKFNLSGGSPRYAASGVVPGYLLNQFSMDEHRGHLRVATTSRGWGWRQGGRAGNNLFVLGQSGRNLRITGQVAGLAPGERIYAARMMGDRGYMVTFRRTDPLYTLDLSNPREPKLMGELKINGFSSYIHPLGRGMLLTVGQDADARGRIRGAHLQIFDVRNMKQPSRTHHYLLTEGFRSSSTAQYDHHAFTFDARAGILALPLSVQSANRWTGVALVRVNARKGFKYVGTVDHADMRQASLAPSRWRCPPNARCSRPPRPSHLRRGWVPINRSVFIDRYVFTLSNLGLKAHDLGQGSPRQVARVRFADRQRVPIRRRKDNRPWH